MRNPKYYNSNKIPYAWSNLNFIGKSDNIITVLDVIEDSKSGAELVEELGKVNMVHNTWVVDRETDTKVRIKHTNRLGNITYIECDK